MDGLSREPAARRLAHRVGAVLALVWGVISFFSAGNAFFSGGVTTQLDAALFWSAEVSLLSMLPLSLLAINKPRIAAGGMLLAYVVEMGAGLTEVIKARAHIYRSSLGALDFVWFLFPFLVPGLLLYASGPGAVSAHPVVGRRAALDSVGRKRLAKWVGLILGVAAGLWQFHFALHIVHGPLRRDGWTLVGFAVPYLVAVPLAVTGLWKTRWAAYGFCACFLFLLATPLQAAHSLGDVIGFLLFQGALGSPFALVAALLFYASQASSQSQK